MFPETGCGVTGDFIGDFTYEEWGIVDLDPLTYEGSGKGKNHGVLTVNTTEGTFVAESAGKISLEGVTGKFALQRKNGVSGYSGLDGHGDYAGSGAFVFAVTFTGQFH